MTSLPRSSGVPAGGEVSTTRPLRTSSENTRSTRLEAGVLERLLGLVLRQAGDVGTGASPGPVETVIVTVDPSGASVLGRGSCAATWSRSTSGLTTVTMSTSKPRFWRICEAVADSRPITSGTVSCSGLSSRYEADGDRRERQRDQQPQPPAAAARSSSTTIGGGRGDHLCGSRAPVSSAAMNSSAFWKRRAGSFSSARSTTASSAGGIAGSISRGRHRQLGDLLERDGDRQLGVERHAGR